MQIPKVDWSAWRELKLFIRLLMKAWRDMQRAIKRYLKWLYKRDRNGLFIAQDGEKSLVYGDANWISREEGTIAGAIHELAILPEYQFSA